MHLPFGFKVTAAVCVGLIAAMGMGALGYRIIGELIATDREEQQRLEVLQQIEAIRLEAARAESLQLGRRLAGGPPDEAELRAVARRVAGAIGELRKLLDDSEQRQRLEELDRAVAARFELLAELGGLRRDAVAAFLAGERWVRSGRRTERIAGAIAERERELLEKHLARARGNSELASQATTWAAVLPIALLAWVVLLIGRYERDRQRAESGLERARERLDFALDASGGAVWDWNLASDEVYLSPGWRRMLGLEARETETNSAALLALVHADDVAGVKASMRDAVNGASPDYREEHRVRRSDGEWIWILSRGEVLQRDPAGKPVRMVGTNQDVTERKRAEMALVEHDERLRLALETAGMVSWNLDLATDQFTWQDDPLRLIGPPPPGGYAGLRDMVYIEDLVRFIRGFNDVAAAGGTYSDQFRIRRTDGRVVWVSAHGHAEHDLAGRVTRIIGVAQDVSEIKEAEQALRASEAQLRLVTDTVPAVISYHDAQERIRFCNLAMARMVGSSREEITGKPLREVLGEDVYGYVRPHVLRALAGEEVRFERTAETPGGPVDLSVHFVPRRNSYGEVEGFYALATDITELKRVDRMKSEFVSTVSHELRTPLTSIRGSLGVLAGGVAGPLPEKARSFIDIALNNCERLIRLINDILDIEKIESGKMNFVLRPLDLMDLIEQTVKANEGFAAQRETRLQVVAAVPEAKVHADGDRLAQVLTNLISNACKFSPPGSTVDVAVTREDGRLRVAVADHGPGIQEEFLDRIFQRFSQADASDARQKGGTGLGLSISKAIVERLGGEIGFTTGRGKGATFYFFLPELTDPAVARFWSGRKPRKSI